MHCGGLIAPAPDYQLYAKAHGGYGARVTRPSDIKPAIGEALRYDGEGKLSAIDVVLSDFNPR